MTAKGVLKTLLPPLLWRALQRGRKAMRAGTPPPWEYVPGGWEAATSGDGWNAPSIAEKQVAQWPQFEALTSGSGPLGIATEAAAFTSQSLAAHNTVMSFAYVLGRAAAGRRQVSMLDWGGGLGHYYVLAQALYPELEVTYCCRDLTALVREAKRLHPGGCFAADDSVFDRAYDLVVGSGSLHYMRDWRGLAGRLSGATGTWLYVTRTPVVQSSASFVVVQRPHGVGYHTEYPGWFLNRGELIGEIEGHGLKLVREFLVDERPRVPGAPEQASYRGFLFAAKRGSASAGDSR